MEITSETREEQHVSNKKIKNEYRKKSKDILNAAYLYLL